ncbi:MAG: addiction module protein [Balneolaceae bacterium]|nr:addiction module protein [Balneolaceae bacterium]
MEDTLIKELSQLNRNEKIILVEALWDSIAADSDTLSVPEHHQKIIEQRLETIDDDKANGKHWDEIRKKYL